MIKYTKSSIMLGKGIVCALIFLMGSCKVQSRISKSENIKAEYISSKTGLKYIVLKEGSGDKAETGDEVLIRETTSYRDGTTLYSNENSDNPIKVKLGANMVTDGVEEGLHGMRSGEIRKLIVPHYLAKRTFYPDNVSPDSTLVIKIIVDSVIKNK